MDLTPSIEDLIARVGGLPRSADRRVVIGVAGVPGAGKSTVAQALVAGLLAGGVRAVQVPMDGFHLADVQLDRLGFRQVKGAPQTFDAEGFGVLLERLRDDRRRPVYAPDFERELERPIAGAIAVDPEVDVVVTEGNYLLLRDDPWPRARAACDEVWFVDVEQQVRLDRLIARHIRFGKSPAAAREWVLRNDEANAVVARAGRELADLIVTMG